jgi:hypothetical protein
LKTIYFRFIAQITALINRLAVLALFLLERCSESENQLHILKPGTASGDLKLNQVIFVTEHLHLNGSSAGSTLSELMDAYEATSVSSRKYHSTRMEISRASVEVKCGSESILSPVQKTYSLRFCPRSCMESVQYQSPVPEWQKPGKLR